MARPPCFDSSKRPWVHEPSTALPSTDMQQPTIDALSEDIGRLKHQISRLKAVLGEARGEVDWLRRRNTELEQLVTKDSHNSSRPPLTNLP